MKITSPLIGCFLFFAACKPAPQVNDGRAGFQFPSELVDFVAYENNPVFKGTGTGTWDQMIRERGFILKEDGEYYLWYTGYKGGEEAEKHLGLATSTDGLSWTRYKDNPIVGSAWVEDMMVVKSDNVYYMFAEGRGDTAHMLTSTDRIHWKEQGNLDIRNTHGKPISPGSYGTPSVFIENGIWYLFYEREDLGVWLAVSNDRKMWTNKQDEPVLKMGPEKYDQYAVAFDQVIKYDKKYYAYYHASEFKDWHEWTSCIAVSDDLIHWLKYDGNPVLRENKSSPVLVKTGSKYALYSMHPEICVHFPKTKAP
jgi:predicted GH43/DUF377 family glycosyl hydrolase